MINKKLLINKDEVELKKEFLNLLKEYFYLKMKLSTNKLKKTHLISNCRKNIAFIKKIIYEKKKNEKKKYFKRICFKKKNG